MGWWGSVSVYRAYDADGQLLYVGVTCNYRERIGDHKRRSKWFPLCKEITEEKFKCGAAAENTERKEIISKNPPFNVKRVRGYMYCPCPECVQFEHVLKDKSK